jgi:glycerophosphoryl diester phosphodiesterase
MAQYKAITPDWLTARPIAHRGLHNAGSGIMENTTSAAKAAIDHGFAIECDVQLTQDHQAVVFHDFDLDRLTTGTGAVAARSAAELANIPMKGTMDRIPLLQDFLALLAGRVPLILEVKSAFDGNMALTEQVAQVVQAYDGPVALKSFDPAVIIALRQMTPNHPRGIVAMNDYSYPDYAGQSLVQKHAMANLLHFDESRPDFISWRVRDLPSAAPYLCRTGLGLPVMTWTVRSEEDRAMANAHADQMVFEGFVP